ncbi:MAG TPA: S53 family peptidase [Streptosporangiaceae bacterium]|nr:S53 family peptidase [Streptosporangiaceae bacterium]
MSDIAGNSFVPLPGSERGPLADAAAAERLDGSERIEVTLVARRRAELPSEYVEGTATLTREELAEGHGGDPADIARIRDVLAAYGLEVTDADASSRRVRVAGTVSELAEVFGASLSRVSSSHPTAGRTVHRYRVGSLRLPAQLDGIVTAVLGLDDRPQARPQFRLTAAAAAQTTYTPAQVGACYQFPAGTDGSGQTLAIIELGGGFSPNDLNTYFSGLGITPPTVSAVGVDRAVNTPEKDPSGADGEVLLDIEVAGALAPGAAQAVYFAPNTDQGFVDAVSTAVQASPTPTAVSISWGQSEDSWTAQARTALDQALADAAALGVTVCVAAGDNGSSDGQQDGQSHADFPASSPHVLACGGTTLVADPATGTVSSETVWNDGEGQGATGGGVSGVFGPPAWQAGAGVPGRAGGGSAGRGVPDVAGDADPATGYQVLVDGHRVVVGGTSAVAPLWAALVCRLAESTGKSFGLLPPLLYAGITPGATTAGFRDITSGSNGAYRAGPGWDACTGLGVPDGTALLARLQA